jgi:hypothetical protein
MKTIILFKSIPKIFMMGVLALVIPSSYGQYEVTTSIGSSHFLGDISTSMWTRKDGGYDVHLQHIHPAFSVGVRRYLSRDISLRTDVLFTKLSGHDRHSESQERKARNLHFSTPIIEGNFAVELHLNKWLGKLSPAYGEPYIFAGVGMLYYEPMARWNGEMVKLRPLGTEGQFYREDIKPYKNYSFSIPYGLGYKFRLKNGSRIGFELNHRKTFTDYIDDVSSTYADKSLLYQSNGQVAVDLSDRSQSGILGFSEPGSIRGNPSNNDTYFFLFVTYSHPITNAKDRKTFPKEDLLGIVRNHSHDKYRN